MARAQAVQDVSRAKAQFREYVAQLTPQSRRAVKAIRQVILAVVPGAVEAFSYGIPAYRHEGRVLIWYAGWKAHVSIYPITASIQKANAVALAGYQTSKGTVRFPLDRPLPLPLIRRLVKARVAETAKPRE